MRAIVPELAIVLVLLLLCGLVLVGIGAAQWAVGLAITQRFAEGRRRRAATREQHARRQARWEARTRYQRGFAVLDVVRVARWDGHELVVATEDQDPVAVPEEDIEKTAAAQLEADLRADRRNRQQDQ